MIDPPDEFIDLMSALYIAASRTFLDRKSAEDAIGYMMDGMDLAPGDMFSLYGDKCSARLPRDGLTYNVVCSKDPSYML